MIILRNPGSGSLRLAAGLMAPSVTLAGGGNPKGRLQPARNRPPLFSFAEPAGFQ